MKQLICNTGKNCKVADVDNGKRQVKFYYAVFESLDSNKWIFNSKAFNRTIKNSKSFPFLREHNRLEVVGKTIEMGTDEYGAWAVAKIANTDRGTEVLQLYQDGILKEHSFVGLAVQGEPITIKNTNATYVKEVALEEVSVVLYAANKNATLIEIENALRNGTLSEEQINALVPANKHNDSPIVEKVNEFDLINFIKNY